MNRLTSYESECKREMICRYEDCDINEEHCPYINADNCACLQEVLEKLAKYEDTGLTPEQIRETDRMYAEKCKELAKTKENQGWIPCSESLPDTSLLGYADVIVMIEGATTSTFLTYYERTNNWRDEQGEIYNVIAWMPLPDAYKGEQYVSPELMQAAREVKE